MDSFSPFGEGLRAVRNARGISQEKLSKKIKAGRNFVGYVERGKQNICLDNILRLARALKVSPAEFFIRYKVKGASRKQEGAKTQAVGSHS